MKPEIAMPVILFSGILYVRRDALENSLDLLRGAFGPVNYESGEIPFTVTDYYIPEMGSPILRKFVAFDRLVDPSRLADIKLKTIEMENTLAPEEKRTVNLDPGYMDYNKVVLASAKYNGQKIYLGRGIYADPTLCYEKGKFLPYAWSFPDFKLGIYDDVFLKIREQYMAALKRK